MEPEIVSDIISRDTANDSDAEEKSEGSRLRIRKPSRISISDVEDDDDLEWNPKSGKEEKIRKKVKPITKRKRRRKKIEEESDSDEENTMPYLDTKSIAKRENYLRKYKEMKEKRSYVCKVCKKTFITASHLKEHVLSHCQCFPCTECGKVFNHSRSLQRHIANGHNPKVNGEEGERDEENEDGEEDEESMNYR